MVEAHLEAQSIGLGESGPRFAAGRRQIRRGSQLLHRSLEILHHRLLQQRRAAEISIQSIRGDAGILKGLRRPAIRLCQEPREGPPPTRSEPKARPDGVRTTGAGP